MEVAPAGDPLRHHPVLNRDRPQPRRRRGVRPDAGSGTSEAQGRKRARSVRVRGYGFGCVHHSPELPVELGRVELPARGARVGRRCPRRTCSAPAVEIDTNEVLLLGTEELRRRAKLRVSGERRGLLDHDSARIEVVFELDGKPLPRRRRSGFACGR